MNIPSRGKYAKDIKFCVVPPNEEDYYIMTVDYSAMQLRLASLDGDDEGLMDLFIKDKYADVHIRTAYNVFTKNRKFNIEEVEVEQDGKVYRFLGPQIVKTVNRGEIFARELTEDDTLLTTK
jgi:DNA polymerase I-like protein with 3'-5' exonuclease and polymerase domains